MRILYSVQGDGKGHAIRSSVVIEWLKEKGHNVLITASNDAYPILQEKFGHVIKIEGSRMSYGPDSVLIGKTLFEFIKTFGKRNTENFDVFYTVQKNFKPELVITDMEPFGYYISTLFNLPLISIDNHFFAHCKIEPKLEKEFMFKATKLFLFFWTWAADYYIVSAFAKQKPVSRKKVIIVPPILRKQILEYKPKDKGHVLVYQTSDKSTHFLDTLKKFDRKFIIYGFNVDKKDKNLVFKKFNEKEYFSDLGDSTAVIANGGYTLMGEAVYLHKPMLAVPIKNQAEQVYNAVCLEKHGYGLYLKSFSYTGIKMFFDNLEKYRKNLKLYKQDKNKILFQTLQKLLQKY